MLKIKIDLLKENISWVTEIRQLNSDILHRHILPRLQHTSYLIDFEFDEREEHRNHYFEQWTKARTFHSPIEHRRSSTRNIATFHS